MNQCHGRRQVVRWPKGKGSPTTMGFGRKSLSITRRPERGWKISITSSQQWMPLASRREKGEKIARISQRDSPRIPRISQRRRTVACARNSHRATARHNAETATQVVRHTAEFLAQRRNATSALPYVQPPRPSNLEVRPLAELNVHFPGLELTTSQVVW